MLICILSSVIIAPVATAEEFVDYGSGVFMPEENTGDMNRIPINNPDALYPVGGGIWGRLYVSDLNGDGYLDLQMNGAAIDERGKWVYYGTADSQNPESPNYLVMGPRLLKTTMYYSEVGPRLLYDDQGNYIKTINAGNGAFSLGNGSVYFNRDQNGVEHYDNNGNVIYYYGLYNPTEIEGARVMSARTVDNPYARISSAQKHFPGDWDGDGNYDLIYSLNEWSHYLNEHGNNKIPDYDKNGIWGDDNDDGIVDERDPDYDTNGDGRIDKNDEWTGDGDDDPMHGWIMYCRNLGDNEKPNYDYENVTYLTYWDYEVDAQGNKKIIEGTERAIDAFGNPNPMFEDFDKDGDEDLITTGFVGYITYYENIGTRKNPVYVNLGYIKDKKDKIIMANCLQSEVVNVDWNGDTYMDFFVWDSEECCVYLVEHTGKFHPNGMPIFTQKQQFRAPSDNLKINTCNSPFSVDWDGDGDEDIIAGDAMGWITYVPNLTIEKALEQNPNQKIEDIDLTNPIWGEHYKMRTPDDKVYFFKAGYKGLPMEGSENLGGPQGPNEANTAYLMVAVVDWDGDGTLDIIENNAYGRISVHKGIKGDPYHMGYSEPIKVEWTGETPQLAWNWWTPEKGDLITYWRIDLNPIDLPLDEDGDGVAEGDGLVDLITVDVDGYVSFFQRYRDRDGSLKLKPGRRVFNLNGNPWQITGLVENQGKKGLRFVDWDCDGDLDAISRCTHYPHGNTSMHFMENVSTVAGQYEFADRGDISDRTLNQHEVRATVCDWNKDGIPDLILSPESGNLYYFKNNLVTAE